MLPTQISKELFSTETKTNDIVINYLTDELLKNGMATESITDYDAAIYLDLSSVIQDKLKATLRIDKINKNFQLEPWADNCVYVPADGNWKTIVEYINKINDTPQKLAKDISERWDYLSHTAKDLYKLILKTNKKQLSLGEICNLVPALNYQAVYNYLIELESRSEPPAEKFGDNIWFVYRTRSSTKNPVYAINLKLRDILYFI